jgi:hypothetical protein
VYSARLLKFEVENVHNILVCEFFYKVTLNTIFQLLETNDGNKYISMVINQYSKWVETQIVANHKALVIVQFLVGSHN